MSDYGLVVELSGIFTLHTPLSPTVVVCYPVVMATAANDFSHSQDISRSQRALLLEARRNLEAVWKDEVRAMSDDQLREFSKHKCKLDLVEEIKQVIGDRVPVTAIETECHYLSNAINNEVQSCLPNTACKSADTGRSGKKETVSVVCTHNTQNNLPVTLSQDSFLEKDSLDSIFMHLNDSMVSNHTTGSPGASDPPILTTDM